MKTIPQNDLGVLYLASKSYAKVEIIDDIFFGNCLAGDYLEVLLSRKRGKRTLDMTAATAGKICKIQVPMIFLELAINRFVKEEKKRTRKNCKKG